MCDVKLCILAVPLATCVCSHGSTGTSAPSYLQALLAVSLAQIVICVGSLSIWFGCIFAVETCGQEGLADRVKVAVTFVIGCMFTAVT